MATLKTTMDTTTPDKTKAPVLPGWGYYLSGNTFDDARVNSPEAAKFLANLRQYDPSAHFQNMGSQSGSEGGGSGGNQYQLVYDDSKLPGGGRPAMVDMNQGAYAGFRDDPNASYAGHLFDNSDAAMSTDPHGYGKVTSPANMNIAADEAPDAIAKYAPMLIATIATLGAAAPAMMAGSGLFDALAAAPTGALSATTGGLNAARAAGSGDYVGAAAGLAGAGLGLGGYGTLGSAVSAAPTVVRDVKRGDYTGAAIAAASPAARAAGIPGYQVDIGKTLAQIYRQQRAGKG